MKPRMKELTPTSDAAENLVKLAHSKKYSLAHLSSLLGSNGRNGSYLQQFVMRGSPEELDLSDRIKLATLLECSLDDLTVDKERNYLFKDRAKKMSTTPFNLMAQSGWIPIMGKTDSEDPGAIDFGGEAKGGKPSGMAVPSMLVGIPGAYATRMPDDVMSPAIRKGAMVFVNPIREPTSGEDVVVLLKNGKGFIRTFGEKRKSHLILTQYNPPDEMVVPLNEVEVIHLIACTTRGPA